MRKFSLLLGILFLVIASCFSPVYAADDDGGDSSSDQPAISDDATVPPFAGGPVTSPIGDRQSPTTGEWKTHSGIDVGIDDAYIYAPVDGYVSHGSGNGFGDGWCYFESDDDAYPIKLRLFFGDLSSDTLYMADGPVSKGTPIGYVLGYDSSVSTGPHVHVEFHTVPPPSWDAPFRYYPEGADDPGPILEMLGVDLSGTTNYSGTGGSHHFGSDDTSAEHFWTVETMTKIGEFFHDLINFWSDKAIAAMKAVTPYALGLLAVLCVIDLTLPILLAGFSVNFNDLFIKILRYSGIMALVYLWPKFINNILLSFVTSFAGIIGGKTYELTTDLTQPQLMFQKAVSIIAPAMQKIGSFGMLDYLTNMGSVIMIYVFTALVIIAFLAATLVVTITYIEFYFAAGLSIVTVPFASWNLSKFIPEGTLGHLISTALKLLLVSILVGMCTICIRDAHTADMFKTPITSASTSKGSYDGTSPTAITDNPYVPMIMQAAQEEGIDPYVALAIAARESGGDDINGIQMIDNFDDPSNPSYGIFQITEGQSVYDPETTSTIYIDDAYPNYRTDPMDNIHAGIAMLKDKINSQNGDIWEGVRAYNGAGPMAEKYKEMVQANYAKISGLPISMIGHTPISEDSVLKYGRLCIAVIFLALMILFIPGRIMSTLGGNLELNYGRK